MEINEQFDAFFFVCVFVSLLIGRFFGRISGYHQRLREEERDTLVCNVTVRTENGVDIYYDLVTNKFIRSGVTPQELREILREQNPDKEIRLVISRET